jgi:CarboxypepD_reg-like domain
VIDCSSLSDAAILQQFEKHGHVMCGRFLPEQLNRVLKPSQPVQSTILPQTLASLLMLSSGLAANEPAKPIPIELKQQLPPTDSTKSVISGIVVDGETKETLVGALVKIKNTNIRTYCDETGRFTLPVSANDTFVIVEVQFTGYNEMMWKCEPSRSETIPMIADSKMLETVIVVSTLIMHKSTYVTGAMVPISASDLAPQADTTTLTVPKSYKVLSQKPKWWQFWKKRA